MGRESRVASTERGRLKQSDQDRDRGGADRTPDDRPHFHDASFSDAAVTASATSAGKQNR